MGRRGGVEGRAALGGEAVRAPVPQPRPHDIVLDDLANISRDLALAGLLRQLCETRPERTVSWDTQNKRFDEMGIPTQFVTRSRLVLIANRWMDRHEEVQALETRCLLVRVPSPPSGPCTSRRAASRTALWKPAVLR